MPAPRLHPAVRLLICALGILIPTIFIKSLMSGAIISLAGFTGRNAATEVNEFWANPSNLLISRLLICPFILLVIISCRRFLDLRSFDSLGLHPRGSLRPFGVGLLCGGLTIAFLFAMLVISGGVRVEGYSREAFGGSNLESLKMCVLYLMLFFAVGYTEELVFRGYALHNLNAFLGWRASVGLQAIVFSIIHFANLWVAHAAALKLPPDILSNMVNAVGPAGGATTLNEGFWALLWEVRWGMVNIALIGIFAALCYRKTGSLWFPIGFSLAWDFCTGCVFSLPVSGVPVFRILEVVSSPNVTLSGGSFGAEGSLLLTFVMATILWLQRSAPPHPQAGHDLALLKPPFDSMAEARLGGEFGRLADSGAADGSDGATGGENEGEEIRENRFKTRMSGSGAPELSAHELNSLAHELSASAARAAASVRGTNHDIDDVALTGLSTPSGVVQPGENKGQWDSFKIDVTENSETTSSSTAIAAPRPPSTRSSEPEAPVAQGLSSATRSSAEASAPGAERDELSDRPTVKTESSPPPAPTQSQPPSSPATSTAPSSVPSKPKAPRW